MNNRGTEKSGEIPRTQSHRYLSMHHLLPAGCTCVHLTLPACTRRRKVRASAGIQRRTAALSKTAFGSFPRLCNRRGSAEGSEPARRRHLNRGPAAFRCRVHASVRRECVFNCSRFELITGPLIVAGNVQRFFAQHSPPVANAFESLRN